MEITLNAVKCSTPGIIEIKTSISGQIPEAQRDRLIAALGGDSGKLRNAVPPRRWTPTLRFHDNPKWVKRLRMIGLIGLPSAAAWWIAVEAEDREFEQNIYPILDQMSREDDPLERKLYAIEAVQAIGQHLGKFFPDSDPVDLVTLGAIYKIIGD